MTSAADWTWAPTLVQLYTGLVYRGPGLVKQTLRALSQLSRLDS